MAHECLFTMDASSIKFGVGATREVGFEGRRLGHEEGHGHHGSRTDPQ